MATEGSGGTVRVALLAVVLFLGTACSGDAEPKWFCIVSQETEEVRGLSAGTMYDPYLSGCIGDEEIVCMRGETRVPLRECPGS